MFKALLPVILVSIVSNRVQAFHMLALAVSPVQVVYFSKQHTDADDATKIIDLILQTVGVTASFDVRKANVPNAAAVVHQGKRYILYNPSFIAVMDRAAESPWASVAASCT